MKEKGDWIRHVSRQPGHFVGTPTAQRMLKWGITPCANSVRRPEECNAISVKRVAKTSAETKGTVFHGCHHSQHTILDCLARLSDRNSLAAIHRIKGVKEETVCEWLQRAAGHVEEIEAVLLANYPVSRAQLDAPPGPTSDTRATRGHCEEEARGSFWRGTTIAIDSRLRIRRAITKTEEEVALELMAQLKARGHSETPPAMATDGKGSYREAMLETWGQVPAYGGRGRPPTQKQPGADWHYLQVVKERVFQSADCRAYAGGLWRSTRSERSAG